MVRRLLAGVLAVGAMLSGAVLVGSAPAEAKTVAVSDTLLPGQKLMTLQSIKSASGVFTLTMQRNGNVTLLQRGETQPLWISGTYRPGSVLVMGTDGTMRIIYGRTQIWSMGAASPNAKLVLPNTGLLAIYNTGGKAVWNRHMVIGTLMPGAKLRAPDVLGRDVTLYSLDHVYSLRVLTSGDMVFRKNGTTVLWRTGKNAGPEAHADINLNGSFCTYTSGNDCVWEFATHRPGTVVQIRNDGSYLLINGRTIVKKFV
ncbi:hypothetical protein [Kribbella speibonae]|uniref:Bulb-type lectin domain-containing protein n=1 Tax=Kribbella speibonae TaxID=1572660 RepID=A0ABY2A034_9ACTN|nr:hypothetical protein [Kribbella speibonae]TCC20959.1 hypothetical protein E0H58_26845 [Kribbella speibonae]